MPKINGTGTASNQQIPQNEERKPIPKEAVDRLRLLTARIMVSKLTMEVSDKVIEALYKIEAINDETKASKMLEITNKVSESLFIANTIEEIDDHKKVMKIFHEIEESDKIITKLLGKK